MGKSSTPAPDYGPLAQASKEAAEVQAALGREQLDFARQQYDESAPILRQIAQGQIDSQDAQMEMAKEAYDYQQEVFRPLERSIVADAQNFNTAEYREQLASQAAADAGLAFAQTKKANQRAMASMGVNPNSGRFQGLASQSNLGLAAQRAGAMNATRRRAEQMGYARQLDAAGLGRGLSGVSTAAYGGANTAGSMAGGNIQSAGAAYMAGMGQGASTIGSGLNMQLSGLRDVLNNQTNAYVNTNDSFLGDLGGFLGGAASLMKVWPSDRRIKENIEEVGVDQRTALTLYEFNYKGDETRRFRGVMADEVELVYPDAVEDTDLGFKAVRYDLLGIEFKEVA